MNTIILVFCLGVPVGVSDENQCNTPEETYRYESVETCQSERDRIRELVERNSGGNATLYVRRDCEPE